VAQIVGKSLLDMSESDFSAPVLFAPEGSEASPLAIMQASMSDAILATPANVLWDNVPLTTAVPDHVEMVVASFATTDNVSLSQAAAVAAGLTLTAADLPELGRSEMGTGAAIDLTRVAIAVGYKGIHTLIQSFVLPPRLAAIPRFA
jgi:hypothetical protein